MIDFGGWELPVQYTGLMDEHLACRSACGMFDVSHMGEFVLKGPGAEGFLNFAITNDISKLSNNQAMYSVLCHSTGGAVDDLVVYRFEKDHFLIVVNAANTEKDFEHFKVLEAKVGNRFGDFELTNESSKYTQIALQGRFAEKILQTLCDVSLADIKTYWFKKGHVLDGRTEAVLARTGYTGEDGFEIYVDWNEGPRLWRALLETGAPLGLKPCGLGARDTLRLEMKYPLYGHELDDHTHPLEAGLGWVTKLAKEDFVGKEAISLAKSQPPRRALVGFKMVSKGIPRQGYGLVTENGESIGIVTSGTHSPSLKTAIGVGYVRPTFAPVGSKIFVDIRGQRAEAEVVQTPFYRRNY